MAEHGHKIEDKVKAMQSEIKKNMQGNNSEGKETKTQINDFADGRNKHYQNKMKKQEFMAGVG